MTTSRIIHKSPYFTMNAQSLRLGVFNCVCFQTPFERGRNVINSGEFEGFKCFLRILQKEVRGSTIWRKKVSSLALVTANEIGKLESFKTKENAVQTVKDLFPTMNDTELIQDIGEMLYTIYQYMDSKL